MCLSMINLSIKTSLIWAGWKYLSDNQYPITKIPNNYYYRAYTNISDDTNNYLAWALDYCREIFLCTKAKVIWKASETAYFLAKSCEFFPDKDEFLVKYRILEIINQGNRVGRWDIKIPSIAAPLPREPKSPFTPKRFSRVVQLEKFLEELENKYGQWPSKASQLETLGGLIIASMAYGGLLDTSQLAYLLRSLNNNDEFFRWINITIYHKKNQDISKTIRWFPDPLSRLLLIRIEKEKLLDPSTKEVQKWCDYAKKHRTKALFQAVKRWTDYCEIKIPFKNFTELQQGCKTRLNLYAPTYITEYASGNLITSGLPESTWKMILKTPQNYLKEIREQTSQPQCTPGSEYNKDDETPTHSAIIELKTILNKHRKRSSSEALKEDISTWLDRVEIGFNTQNDVRIPSLLHIGHWCIDSMLSKIPGQRILEPNTVRNRVNAIGPWLVGLLGTDDLSKWHDAKDFTDFYQIPLTASQEIGEASFRLMKTSIKDFHNYLMSNYNTVPNLDREGLYSKSSREFSKADAHYIPFSIYKKSIHWLKTNTQADLNILFHLMQLEYHTGLRPSEALGINLDEIFPHAIDEKELWLDIRDNNFRKIKTRSGVRLIPLHILLSEKYLHTVKSLLIRQLNLCQNSNKHKNTLITDNKNCPVSSDNQVLNYIKQALIRSGHIPDIRNYHCRHSFANNFFLALTLKSLNKTTDELPLWFMENKDDREEITRHLVNLDKLLKPGDFFKNGMMLLASLLGHNSPISTSASYIHVYDFALGQYMKNIAPSLRNNVLSKLINSGEEYVRKLLLNSQSNSEKIEKAIHQYLAKNQKGFNRYIIQSNQNSRSYDSQENILSAYENILRLHHLTCEHAIGKNILDSEYYSQNTEYFEIPRSFHEATAGFMIKSNNGGINQCFDMPVNDSEIALAKQSSEILAKNFGLFGHKPLLNNKTRNTFKKLLIQFQKGTKNDFYWIPNTDFSILINSLKSIKEWIALINLMGLSECITLHHVPKHNKNIAAITQQNYWNTQLSDYKIKSYPSELPKSLRINLKSRGSIVFTLDMSKNDKNQYSNNDLFALRWIFFYISYYLGLR